MNLSELWTANEAVVLSRLRANTTARVRDAAKGVQVRFVKQTNGSDGQGAYRQLHFETKNNAPTGERDTHQVRVRFYKGHLPVKSSTLPTWVDCTCEDFRFRWDYALNQDGASSGKRARGEPQDPAVKNPKGLAAVCKHTWAVMEWIKAKKGL